MENSATIVTCFFDINREGKGDGRSLNEYKQWMKETLKLNCNLYIVTEEKFKDFFIENRNTKYNTVIKIIRFGDLHYYKYIERMREIVNTSEYKSRIQHPNRVECILPEYNVIQYSKFHCLKMAMEENAFHSSHFIWMDVGSSRFFQNINIHIYTFQKYNQIFQSF